MDEKVKITHSLRKRFVKDYGLPITVVQDPYFMHFIELYEDLFGAKTKYEEFVRLVNKLGGEGEFFAESKRIINSAIRTVKDTDSYKEFCEPYHRGTDLYDMFNVDFNLPKINIYSAANVGKTYLSIDMVKANYQSLMYFDCNTLVEGPKMVSDTSSSYDEFIAQFTDEDYFKKSKQIRQVIFGNLNPKRQQKIQRKIMLALSELLTEQGFAVVCGSSDELLIDISNLELSNSKIVSVAKTIGGAYLEDIEFRYTVFTLGEVAENRPFYYKEFLDGTFELKKVPSHYFAEVYRFMRAENTEYNDLVTFLDGRLVRYIDTFLAVKNKERTK